MLRRLFLPLSFVLVASSSLAVVACGGSGGGGSGGSAGGGAGGDAGGGSGGSTGGAPPVCDAPGYGGAPAAVMVGTVTATVEDSAGAPLVGIETFVCGLDICSPAGSTDAMGNTSLTWDADMSKPAFKYGDGIYQVKFVIPVAAGDTMVGTAITEPMPATGAAMAPGGSVTSGDVTLDFAANATIEFDLIVDDADKERFRAVTFDPANLPSAVDAALGLVAVYGLGPLDTYVCPAATMTVPNDAGLAAGSAVEFWIHGASVSQDWAEYGGWAKVSDGAVSADGMTITTDAAGGIPVLSVVGIRPAP